MVREWEHRESDCPWYTEHQRRHCYANIREMSEKNIKTARPPSLWFHPINNWLIQDIFSNDLETIHLSFLTLYTLIQKFHPRTAVTKATVKEKNKLNKSIFQNSRCLHYSLHFLNLQHKRCEVLWIPLPYVLSPISSFLLKQEADPDKVGDTTAWVLPFHFHLANAVSELLDPQDTEDLHSIPVSLTIFCWLDLPKTERGVSEPSCRRAYLLRIVLSSWRIVPIITA